MTKNELILEYNWATTVSGKKKGRQLRLPNSNYYESTLTTDVQSDLRFRQDRSLRIHQCSGYR